MSKSKLEGHIETAFVFFDRYLGIDTLRKLVH